VSKNIPERIVRNLKKDYEILIIFGTNILKQLAIEQTFTFTFPPHPTSASALPGKSRTSEICVEMPINFISPDLWAQQPVDYKV